MERRKALVVAGTIVGTLAAAGSALALNLGVLASADEPAGQLDLVEVPQLADEAPAGDADGYEEDDEHEEYEEHEDEEHEDHEDEDGHEEYEGGEDDD